MLPATSSFDNPWNRARFILCFYVFPPLFIALFLVDGGVMSSMAKLLGLEKWGCGGKLTQWRISVTVSVLQSIGSKWWPRNCIGVLCSGLLCHLGLIRYILVVKMRMRIWDISSFPRSLSDCRNGYYVPWEWQMKVILSHLDLETVNFVTFRED